MRYIKIISHSSEARMLGEELGFTLDLSFPHPKCRDNTDGADVPRDKIDRHLKKAAMEQRKTEVKEKRWQGKLLAARREEDRLNQRSCFAWLKNWDCLLYTSPSPRDA